MEITSAFVVPLSPSDAWTLLLDFERVSHAMPGARLTSIDGDELAGAVVIKLGPMRVEYVGKASLATKDAENRRLVIEAAGTESRGNGSAVATIETVLTPDEEGTLVAVSANLDVTGRPAQMGAGLIEDVAQRLTDEFASRLRDDLSVEGQRPSAEQATSFGHDTDEDALNLTKIAGGPFLIRLTLVAVVVAIVVSAVWLMRKAIR